MKRLDMIEECSGLGRIFRENGEFILEAQYHLQVLQVVHVTPSEDLPGLKQIEGTVNLSEQDSCLVGEHLILRLEDGRHLDFFFVDSGGMIAHRGGRGLYRPEGIS